MKNSTILLAILATLFATWQTISLLIWAFSEDMSFRSSATSVGAILIMFLFGWIPAVIVAIDLDKQLDN
jgi:uncharacterized membrane protein